jgi:hypothetical protein
MYTSITGKLKSAKELSFKGYLQAQTMDIDIYSGEIYVGGSH